jgi:subtilisin family serine protease
MQFTGLNFTMKKIYIPLVCCIFFFQGVYAQHTRFIIQLKDKKESPFTISDPSAYLSIKAIERRNRQQLRIDSSDLPVSPAYLAMIRALPGVTILNKSNWLNQVCIQTSNASSLSQIRGFPFVINTSPVAARIDFSRINDDEIPVNGTSFSRVAMPVVTAVPYFRYGNSQAQVLMHRGDYLHNQQFAGEGLTIAILDGGFFNYKTNPAFDSVRLQNRVLGEWDFVNNEQSVNEDNIHGMYCFSIMASNVPGVLVGSAPKAAYYLFRTEDVFSEYPVEEQNWIAAAERADSLGADMISSSLGYVQFDDHTFDHSYEQRDGRTSMITRAANLAARKGLIVMCSAGNSGNSNSDLKYISCPADGDSVVTIGSVDARGIVSGFSGWGPNGAGKLKPNLVSMGQGTAIANTDGTATSSNGTSLSTPNLAGLVASLWQAFPERNSFEIIDAVQRSAHLFNQPDFRHGYGIPDFKKAFALLVLKGFSGTVSNNGCVSTLSWTGKSSRILGYQVERKAGFETSFSTIGAFSGTTDAFSGGSFLYKDTLQYAAGTSVQYRITQVMPEDSTIELFNATIQVPETCNIGSGIQVNPSPFTNRLVVRWNNVPLAALTVSLYNMKGQRLWHYSHPGNAGITSVEIPAAHLPAGSYVLTVRDHEKILLSKKMIK